MRELKVGFFDTKQQSQNGAKGGAVQTAAIIAVSRNKKLKSTFLLE